MSVNLFGILADLHLSQRFARLHVTIKERTCQYELTPSRREIRSEPTADGCASRDCGLYKSGSQTCARLHLSQRRTASPLLLPIARGPGRINTSSMLSPIGAEPQALRNEAR